jgi:hypothetical protein
MICVTAEGIAASNAAALKTAGPPGARHWDQQGSLDPVSLPQLRQEGTASGSRIPRPLDESIASAPVVERLDFASASGERNLAQTGPGRPSGDPASREGFHTAPTGADSLGFRVNAPRQHTAALYLPGPGGAV